MSDLLHTGLYLGIAAAQVVIFVESAIILRQQRVLFNLQREHRLTHVEYAKLQGQLLAAVTRADDEEVTLIPFKCQACGFQGTGRTNAGAGYAFTVPCPMCGLTIGPIKAGPNV